MRLKGKCILVTGSTTGIGEAIARRCVAEGARVMIHGLERELGEAVADSLGSAVALVVNDLSEAKAAPDLINATLQAFGGLDGIVNNAAYIPRTNLHNTYAALFDRTMAINVRAPMLLIQSAFAHLKRAKGSVLNIGSVNAYCGERELLSYSISKGALMTLTRNLADALGVDGIRVNQMNLGWVFSTNEDRVQQGLGRPVGWQDHLPREFAPSGRILMPEDVAAAAIYWLSDESRLISGTVMELAQFPVIGRNPAKRDSGAGTL